MAKVTAVIDIGSNSARMVVFERTSRFGFHLIKELKSRVRISEDTYENGGYLQPKAIERALKALEDFVRAAKGLKARKILAVATSATRDAPNGKEFVNRAKKELGLNIKIIDGEKEAYLGAIAALNLLPIESGLTVDIGGGSTELALIEDRKVKELISLNIGTIRLKELFFDRKASIEEAKAFIAKELDRLPENLRSETIIGIGGTLRALSKSLLKSSSYPIVSLHGYRYSLESQTDILEKIYSSHVTKLKKFNIKEDRFDTIREGVLIFHSILERVCAKEVVTSGVGVREGLFLSDLLRGQNHVFPKNFNPSIRSLIDRFCVSKSSALYRQRCVKKIFETLKPRHGLDDSYRSPLETAAKLSSIGVMLNFYSANRHGSYFLLNTLTYAISHEDRALISTLVNFSDKKLPTNGGISELKKLLPSLEILKWLSFMLTLGINLNIDESHQDLEFELVDDVFYIKSKNEIYLAKESIRKVEKPTSLAIIFKTHG
jgi:exopolyphosphatase/guanosine-5'-triphosphate,3'-diphosphate pyrophosphatase